MIIYKVTNLINQKIYIGKTIKKNKNYLGSGNLIKLAVKRYGRKNFSRKILEECNSIEELNKQEKFWIEELNSNKRGVGYNITNGGEGGDVFTNNSNKEAIRIKLRENGKKSLGRYHTEESKQKNREKHFGVSWGKHTKETKEKISKLHKGRKFTEEHKRELSKKRKLRITTEKTKKKMSNAWTDEMKEKQASRNRKSIICNETKIEYSCMKEASNKMGFSKSSIYHNLHGRNKNVHGYTFKFKEV